MSDKEYWRKAADEAKTKGAALVAFGVYAGLVMAEREQRKREADVSGATK
jgi:hypothetical protein